MSIKIDLRAMAGRDSVWRIMHPTLHVLVKPLKRRIVVCSAAPVGGSYSRPESVFKLVYLASDDGEGS